VSTFANKRKVLSAEGEVQMMRQTENGKKRVLIVW